MSGVCLLQWSGQNKIIAPLSFCHEWQRQLKDLHLRCTAIKRQTLSNVGQSLDGWPKNLLSRAPPSSGRHVKPLVPAAFAVVITHQPALGPRGGLWPILLMCNQARAYHIGIAYFSSMIIFN
jgi:hypothetical protein